MAGFPKGRWFEREFGFIESEFSYPGVRNRFIWDPSKFILQSKANKREFYVGKFETPTIFQLYEKYLELSKNSAPKERLIKSPKIIFGSVEDLIKNEENKGAVFQVASQFNCLEMVSPEYTPEDGIAKYENDKTQGPACALSCPAATVYRNYFANFDEKRNEIKQINLLEDIETCINNEKNKYWSVINGYCFAGPNFAQLKKHLENERNYSKILANLKIGIHWETDVFQRKHQICQVFCSALPISYNSHRREEDWENFAKLVLEGYYKGCLLVGAIDALQKKEKKKKVFLTLLGGGAFGNPAKWIDEAIQKSLDIVDSELIDVYLVKYGQNPSL